MDPGGRSAPWLPGTALAGPSAAPGVGGGNPWSDRGGPSRSAVHGKLAGRDTPVGGHSLMAPGERTIYDVERGLGSIVSSNIIFDQDDSPVDDTGRLPSIDSTPRSNEPMGSPRHAHALPRSTRRERRALKKQKRRERSTVFGRHPKSTVVFAVLLLLSPLWYSLGLSLVHI